MKKQWINTFITSKKFLCIEISTKNDIREYHAVLVDKKKDSLFITSTYTTTSFDELLQNIPNNRPTLLSFTGQGIISKKVESSTSYRSKLLFNTNLEDFFWYEFIESNNIFVSVIRKKIIEDTLSDFKKHNISIVDISVGPIIIAAIKPLLPLKTTLNTQNYQLIFSNNKLQSFGVNQINESNLSYDIEGEKISVKEIIPFSNLVNHLYPNESIVSENNFLIQNKKEFYFKKAFKTIGLFALPSFLILLLMSYLLLGYYQNKYMNLQVELSEENITLNKLTLLEKDKENKEKMLQESGLNNDNFLSYYIAEITKEIPQEINLTELYIFPPQSKIKKKQRILFTNNLIKLEGIAHTNEAFTKWIKRLKQLKWINNLEIVEFKKEGKNNTFQIKITVDFNV